MSKPKAPRGRPATKCRFNNTQTTLLTDWIKDFDDHVRKENPDLSTHHSANRIWVKKKLEDISKHPEFQKAKLGDGGDVDVQAYMNAISTQFTNHFNNRMRKGKKGSVSGPISPEDSATAIEVLKSSFLSPGMQSPRKIFEEENKDAIVVLAAGLNGTSSCGKYQTALKELWACADQDVWAEKAKINEDNIPANQQSYTGAMYILLHELVHSGAMGDMAIFQLAAFRDQSTGKIEIKVVNCMPEDEGYGDFREHLGETYDDLLTQFETFADTQIPAVTKLEKNTLVKIPFNDDNIAVFPNLDVDSTSAAQYRPIVNDYLKELYRRATGKRAANVVPYEDIVADRSRYFDLEKFPIANQIGDPLTMKNVEVIQLGEGLVELPRNGDGVLQFRILENPPPPPENAEGPPRPPSPTPPKDNNTPPLPPPEDDAPPPPPPSPPQDEEAVQREAEPPVPPKAKAKPGRRKKGDNLAGQSMAQPKQPPPPRQLPSRKRQAPTDFREQSAAKRTNVTGNKPGWDYVVDQPPA